MQPTKWLEQNDANLIADLGKLVAVQSISTDGEHQKAIDALNDGEKDDCEHNEGRRRNDYELRRAQILVKKGDHEQAEEDPSRTDRAAADSF